MRRIAATIAVATVAATLAMAGGAPAFAAHRASSNTTTATYYLSLGDSLAQGVQPNSSGVSVETNQGYPNQLFTALHMTNPTLKLVKLGCPGETTTTMINGGICTYSTGSQLKQAVAFINKHHASIKLITIDIGANDLNPCVTLTSLPKLIKCLEKAFKVIKTNLATIMAALTAAGGSNLPPTIGMTYYVPELAGWLQGTPAAKALAKDSVALGQAFGSLLSGIYTAFGAKVADVFDAFQSTVPFSKRVNTAAFGRIPLAVAYVCSYTWQCAPPPRGPNEHANVLGYGIIANTFLTTYLGT